MKSYKRAKSLLFMLSLLTGVTALNAAVPLIESNTTTAVTQNELYYSVLKSSDADGDALNWDSSILPSWLSVEIDGANVDSNTTSGLFSTISNVVIASDGSLFVLDSASNTVTIKKIATDGTVSNFCGRGSRGAVDGNASIAAFYNPIGMAIDSNDIIYIADTGKHTIRRVDTDGNVTTIAGLSGVTGSVDGNSSVATFNKPYGIAVSTSGNIYVADLVNQKIRKIDTNGTVTTVAGSGKTGYLDGNATTATFNFPLDLVVDEDENLYVVEINNNDIRKIDINGTVTTFVGSSTSRRGYVNAVGTEARFDTPRGIARASDGTLYMTDEKNNAVRVITPEGVVDDFISQSSNLISSPRGITVGPDGIVYVVGS